MTIVYIAGPMTGLPDYNYPAFEAAAEHLRECLGYDVVSPHELFGGDTTRPYGDYMRTGLMAMLGCDEVYMLPGWERSRGASLERKVAEACGIPVRVGIVSPTGSSIHP